MLCQRLLYPTLWCHESPSLVMSTAVHLSTPARVWAFMLSVASHPIQKQTVRGMYHVAGLGDISKV